MGRHPNSLKALEENRKKGQIKSGEQAVRMGHNGGIASGIVRNWKSLAFDCTGEHWNAEVEDPNMRGRLKKANLPPTHFGQTMYNAWKIAGKNPAMLRIFLEMMGILKEQQTSVTVNNNNPFSRLSDDELYAEIKRLKNE